MMVQKASMEHWEVLCEMEKSLFGAHGYAPDSVKQELQNPNRVVLVAMEKEQAVGYVMLNLLPDQTAEIMKIGVLPAYRRQGIGQALLEKSCFKLKNVGCNQLWLEVNQKNVGAIALYESVGFVLQGMRKNYYNGTENALIYKLNL